MIKIAVCDDNRESLETTVELVNKWAAENGETVRVYSYDNGDNLITGNKSIGFDLIFLDIIMPLLNGMDAARELRREDSAVQLVFLTSSPEFAVESYDVKAKNYLLKPVSFEKMSNVLSECAEIIKTEAPNFLVKTGFGYQKLYFRDIEYAEAQNKRVTFYLRDGKTVESTEPLYYFEEKFSQNDGFFKCHRSYLIYMPNVDHFGNAEIITKSGRSVPIARGFAKDFKEAYFTLMFNE